LASLRGGRYGNFHAARPEAGAGSFWFHEPGSAPSKGLKTPMSDRFSVKSPVDGSAYVERPFATATEVERALAAAVRAQRSWKRAPLSERVALATQAVEKFVARSGELAEEITRQMGRPISQSPGEIRGFEDRARYMIGVAEQALADIDP